MTTRAPHERHSHNLPAAAPQGDRVRRGTSGDKDDVGRERSYWDLWLFLACLTRADRDFDCFVEQLFHQRQAESGAEAL